VGQSRARTFKETARAAAATGNNLPELFRKWQ
jgi:hypothetical protein